MVREYSAQKHLPPLESGVGVARRRHRLTRPEFERRYAAAPYKKR
ncbi:hypothetical protein [Nostoc sp. LEGE 12450]|nr:hypothetical protein [Nostoc sp. LEGE 12450]